MSDGVNGAGLDPDVARMIANELIAVDGAATEVLPHFWVTSGFTAYDGHILLATFDATGQPASSFPDLR